MTPALHPYPDLQTLRREVAGGRCLEHWEVVTAQGEHVANAIDLTSLEKHRLMAMTFTSLLNTLRGWTGRLSDASIDGVGL